ncbi:MAG: D-alanyl-D-alanine carboxypeptidase/D-alanyl-D-alanine endopeptidase [Gallionella sp.]
MKKFLTMLLLLSSVSAPAAPQNLPETVQDALKRAGIPVGSVGIWVQEQNAALPLLNVNGTHAMNPASTMKLLTTTSALESLTPAYRWKTEAYLDGKLNNGILQGNLVFKGYGNPKLTIEQFWLWMLELRQRGLREIRGDVVLDTHYFAPLTHDPAEFDNDPTRAYNVGPNALLLNFNALRLRLIPNGASTTALLEPALAGYTVQNRVRTSSKLACHPNDAYSAHLEGRVIVLQGEIAADCGEVEDYFSLLPHEQYFYAAFVSLWQELGGTVQGKVRAGIAPLDVQPFSTHTSTPVAEVIRDINKFSNNIMARHLFLTLSGQDGIAASTQRSAAWVQQWLAQRNLIFPELVLENGAGLSRLERISPQHLAQVLQYAANSPYSAELQASLPILGIDGTVKKRFKNCELTGHAHLKTGTLEGVKSIAGYVDAQTGKHWLMVFIINHPRAAQGQAAQDALIAWLQKND